MFRSMSNMPIFRRLFIVFAVATIVPVVAIVVLGNFYLQSISVRDQAVKTSFEAQNGATQQQIELQRMNALLSARFGQIFAQGGSLLNGDPSLESSGALIEAEINGLETSFDHQLVNYEQNYEIASSNNMGTIRSILASDAPDSPVVHDQMEAIDAVSGDNGSSGEWQKYKALQDKVLTDLGTDPLSYETAYADLYQANTQFSSLRRDWQGVVDAATAMGIAVTNVGPSLTTPLTIAIIIATIFTLLIMVTAGFLVIATITRPLNQLVTLTRRVAEGETGARAEIRGRDEIYQVASAINGMLDRIVRLIQEAQNRHAALQAQLEKLVNEVSGVGEGDLRIQAEVTTDELGVLADSFNFMAEELSNLVVNVKMLTREVQRATAQAYDHMARLVDDADVQIQQIATATVEVGNVANSSHKVAERTQALYAIALDARQTAHGGRNSVYRTVESMNRINDNVHATSEKVQSLEDRSREINNIVKVISSIAHQTNRLALDAAIQAAMAGENGKGFGAVAVDIRRLAEQAKQQTAAINQIVRNVLDDISTATVSMRETERETVSGTQVAQQVGTALESIFSVVEHQAGEIEAINQIAMQQLQSSSTVVQIMQNVSDTTQHSSVSTHEAARQMERLARLAGQLLASVEVFKLREDRIQSVTISEMDGEQSQLPFQGPFGSLPTNAQSVNQSHSFEPAPQNFYYPEGSPQAGWGGAQLANNGSQQAFNPTNGSFPYPVHPFSPIPSNREGQPEFSPAPGNEWQRGMPSQPLQPQNGKRGF